MPHLTQVTGVLRQAHPHAIRLRQNCGFWATATTLLALCPSPALAQSITLDGSLGSSGPIPTRANANFDTIYDIRENLGQTRGSNLFHSFGRFNLGIC
jgi:large exoprotein involved in heme utilization and adhesion